MDLENIPENAQAEYGLQYGEEIDEDTMDNIEDTDLEDLIDDDGLSNCCGAMVVGGTFCSDCGEHCK